MYRRALLNGFAGALTATSAGCLDRFETRSVWETPPLVTDRPDAVYVPSAVEGMYNYGTKMVDDVAVGLFASFPHRFWLVTGDRRKRVEVTEADTMHLMASVWDPETGLVPPAEVSVELARDSEQVPVQVQLWPMLAQRMGFHYGDNVQLPGQGTYDATIRVSPTSAETTGALAGRFDETIETTISLEFDPATIYDLGVERVDQRRWGTRGALPLMIDQMELSSATKHITTNMRESQSSDTGHLNEASREMHPPNHPRPLRVPSIDALPGQVLEAGISGDARMIVMLLDSPPGNDQTGTYLAVSPRTPYNRLGLPYMSLSVSRDAAGAEEKRTRLTERLDEQLGHHYGAVLDVDSGEELTLVVESPPQTARHGGYEMAFFEMEDLSVTLP